MEYSLLERDSSINMMHKTVLEFASTHRANISLQGQMMALRRLVYAGDVSENVAYMEYIPFRYNYIWVCKTRGGTTVSL